MTTPSTMREDSNECDECSGSGVYFIDDKPQQCICLNMLDETQVQRAFDACRSAGFAAGVEKAYDDAMKLACELHERGEKKAYGAVINLSLRLRALLPPAKDKP